jgi:hypothetical protein
MEADERTVRNARLFARNTRASIQGDHGSDRLFRAAWVLVREFMLSDQDALRILVEEFNPRCAPPWSRWDLERKITEARKSTRHICGYGLNRPWDSRWTRCPELGELVSKLNSSIGPLYEVAAAARSLGPRREQGEHEEQGQ